MGADLLLTTLLLIAPAVITSLVVGLVVSILQALTSIQEQTMTFAPRIVAVSLVMIFTLPWMIQVVVNFTQRMFWYSTEAGL
jgi:flagellar biosynthetic protein FliQ